MKPSRHLISPKKILIVKPSSLGDVIHSLPFLNAVKTGFSKAKIHWIIAKGLEGILEGHPMIDQLWVINKDAWKNIGNIKGTLKEIGILFKELHIEKFDLVIDLQGLLRSGVLTKATAAPMRIGFQEAREGSRVFYTHKIKGGKDVHAVDRYLKIADFLGCGIADVCFPLPLFFKSAIGSQLSALNREYAVIVPGARWRTKMWPSERYGELSSRLPLKTVIVGSKKDEDIAKEIVALSHGNAESLAGKTEMKELIEVIRGARFLVSNDSGPMHIAASVGVPVFAIFGPTDPRRTGPYGKGHTIIRENIPCSPCFKRTCDHLKCMNELSVHTVYEKVKNFLV